MSYNYITGQWDADQTQQPQGGPSPYDFSSYFGQGQQQNNPNMNYTMTNPAKPQNGPPPGTQWDTMSGSYLPAYTGGDAAKNPAPDMWNQPGPGYQQNDPYFNNSFLGSQHGMSASAPQSGGSFEGDPATAFQKYLHPNEVATPTPPGSNMTTQPAPTGPVGTGLSATDRNNQPFAGAFWSGTQGHWVDPTGQRDGTGRVLNPSEQQFWKQYDTTRAQNTAAGITTPYPTDQQVLGQPPSAAPSLPPSWPLDDSGKPGLQYAPQSVQQQNGAVAGGAAYPSQNYANLYGDMGQGWQQGFNELNNKQFTHGSDAFNQAFGSTGGMGVGNNFNWNVVPNPDLTEAAVQGQNEPSGDFKQKAIAFAAANPNIDFEPTVVDGKWVLGSRARDVNAQKSLLAPVLPTTTAPATGGGGGGGGGARTSSGTGSTARTSSGTGAPVLPAGTAKPTLGSTLGIGTGGQQQRVAPSVDPSMAAHLGAMTAAGRQAIQAMLNPWGNQSPYYPATGTGAGYIPTAPQTPPVSLPRRSEAATDPPGTHEGQVKYDQATGITQLWTRGRWVRMG